MSNETPLTADTDKDWERFIPSWVENLQEEQRGDAIEGLASFVRHRLIAVASLIDRTAGAREPVFDERIDRIAPYNENTLFQESPAPTNVREFYERSAASIREWLIVRLQKLIASCQDPEIKKRLVWWSEFHKEAGSLPDDLRTVHDVMFYANRQLKQAAKTLGGAQEIIDEKKAIAVGLLLPLFDKARGKS